MLRTWPALLSWGAGLTHLALGAAVMAAPSPGPRIAVAMGLILLGASELVWGALVLRSGRLIWSRALAPAAMAAVVLGGASLVAGSPPLAAAIGTALAIGAGLAGISSVRRARGTARTASARPVAERHRAVGTVLGAILVAGLTTPALATTDPALNGQPHGHDTSIDMPMMDPHAHH
ncbi:hypothetical protein [uncultured Microbacterium sp.]|uniref:hypothetical protein n=1 Tax=uncultured Microbacterium sp. TaxID=191216 RepID=UPI0025F700BC|nr:hypothetical protein [uncultured Microbacterium sp.]